MPEQFAEIPQETPRTDRSILLVINNETEAGEALGSQFLFGVIPFTRLYLEHGPTAALRECWLNTLSRLAPVYLTRPEHAARAIEILSPSLVLEPALSEVSINGFDAIFFRVLSVKGRLTVKPAGVHSEEQTIPFSKKLYGRYAHIGDLSQLLHSTLVEAALSAWARFPARRKTDRAPRIDGAVIVIAPPDRVLTELYRSSNRSTESEVLKPSVLSRLLQMGMADEAVAAGIQAIESSQLPGEGCREQMLVLKSRISDLTALGESLSFNLDLSLNSCVKGRVGPRLASLLCRANTPLNKNHRESLARALERAGRRAARALFSFPKSPGADALSDLHCEVGA